MDEPTARLGWPLAFAAAGGAAIASSMTRWWLLGPLHGPLAMLVGVVVGGWFGAMLTHSLRADAPRVTWRKALVTAVIAGPLSALAVTVVCDYGELGAGTLGLGCVFALVLLPCVAIVLLLARAASRSRERSLVGRSDRRAAWRATAVWLSIVAAIGALPAMIDGSARGDLADLFWWSTGDREVLARVPLVVSLAACVLAAAVAVADARAERILVAARRVSDDWRAEPAEGATTALDVGIGFDAWMEHVGGRATYREHALERVAAFGDLAGGCALLRASTRRSAVALAIAGAAELFALATYVRVL